MEWKVAFYRTGNGAEPVKDLILSLPEPDRAKIIRLMEMLARYGVLLKEPYSRQVEGKLRELRATTKAGELRIFYSAFTGKTFVLLHVFMKKTRQTPQREIDTALRRMRSVIEKGERT